MKFGRANDYGAPTAIYNWRLYTAAICAATAAIMIGYDSAFIGTSISLASFKDEFGLQHLSADAFANKSANIVSVYQAGAFFGAMAGYPLGYFIGRRNGLFISALTFVLGAGLMCGANGARGLGLIYGGRAIAGFGIGSASNLTPLYLSEIAPPAIRGQLVGMYEIGWQVGGIVGYWINYGCSKHIPASHKQWFIPFAIQLVPGGLFALLIPIAIKESPRWLIQKGKRAQAISSLSYLRNLPEDHDYLIDEVNQIQVQVEHDRTAVGSGFMAPIKGIFTKWYLTRRLLITTSLFIFQNGTGINAVNYYSPTFFKSIGITGQNTSLLTTGVFGVIKALGALLWAFWWVDQYGRRPVLLVGAAGGAVAMLVIGGILGATDPAAHPKAHLPPSGAAAIAFFYIWTAFYSMGWNGTPWVVNSEVFPGAVRQISAAAAAMSNWLWNFVISRATPTMFLKMGGSGYGVYIFFGVMQIFSIIFIVFLLPETKGIPLESMDMLFSPGINTWNANKLAMAQLENERVMHRGEHSSYLKPGGGIAHLEKGSQNGTSTPEEKVDMNIHP